MILHQIEALSKVQNVFFTRRLKENCNDNQSHSDKISTVQVGVTEVVLAVNYRPELMSNYLKKYESEYHIKITYSQETTPLGTGKRLF